MTQSLKNFVEKKKRLFFLIEYSMEILSSKKNISKLLIVRDNVAKNLTASLLKLESLNLNTNSATY